MKGYYLHIESDENNPSYFKTKKEVYKEIRNILKEYNNKNKRFKRVSFEKFLDMCYIVNANEYNSKGESLC